MSGKSTNSLPRKPLQPYRGLAVRAALSGGDGHVGSVDERLDRLEHLLEKLQSALDVQFARTASIQAELDHLKAKQKL